jgi:MFS family permease
MAAAVAPSLLPAGDRIGWEGRSVAAGVIFVGSYLALAIGRIPGLSIDRAGIALVGAGLMVASGALTPLVVADIMRGTGRYNLALGAIGTMVGIGASLSGLGAGVVVDHFGYSATFLTLGAAALVAVIVFALGMPETAEPDKASPQS